MAAEDVLSEALARIEFKLDLLLRQAQVPPVPMDLMQQICPICRQPVDYQINVTKKVVVRKCGCRTGKVPPDMDLVNPPLPGIGERNGNAEPQGPEAQDRNRRR